MLVLSVTLIKFLKSWNRLNDHEGNINYTVEKYLETFNGLHMSLTPERQVHSHSRIAKAHTET